MKRFYVKKVKIVWRNSMLAGNPVERSFTKFGVYDRNWQEDQFCCCPRPGGEWATNNGQSRKYRIVVDNEEVAKRIAVRLEELASVVPNTQAIDFNGLHSYFSEKDDVNNITIKAVKTLHA